MSATDYAVPMTDQQPLWDPTIEDVVDSHRGNIRSSFPSREKTPDRGDGRHGVNFEQDASCTPTYTTKARAGVRLQVPGRIMAENAGTMTREEYYEWRT